MEQTTSHGQPGSDDAHEPAWTTVSNPRRVRV